VGTQDASAYDASLLVRPSAVTRDDRIYPETRWVLACVIPFLVVAFGMLYFWPDDTGRLFAWTIKPRMTPLLMGAGYVAGAYFFARTLAETRWHRVHIGFLPVTTFAASMGLATILHWDRFNHHHISFYAWAFLYATTPFIVLGLWLSNRRADPGTSDPDDVAIPSTVRWVTGGVGAVILGTGVLLFLFPQAMIDVWAWKLTPLTARVVGGWFALPGVFGLGIASDRRWSAARLALQSQALGIVLILIGVARAWADFDRTRPLTWAFVAGMAGLLVAIVALYAALEARRARPIAAAA
jgi:hypothetical protein